ncbi:translation initiation factor IF-6 [Candidatus Woesearchaeota archaeon]|nr:translation initiation factor IF-6 [Candidatus Woesearchaeota archaeon]
MHLLQTSFHQDPNVGLHGFANDKFCLLASHTPHEHAQKVEKVLNVPVHLLNICGTSLIGAFVAGNNKCILLPTIVFDSELHALKKLNITYHVLNTDYTALGNNMIANDHACLISPYLAPCQDEIREALQVENIKVMEIDYVPVIGSLLALNSKGCLLSAFASEEDAQFVEKFFGVPVTRGTVNLGSPYVRSGIIVNSHGLVIGGRTGGPEAVAIDEALGFLN